MHHAAPSATRGAQRMKIQSEKERIMAYLAPTEFVTKMIDAGESKIFMSTRDTLIRSYMAGAILSLAAAFAVTVTVQTGQPLVGAMLFPVGFILLYLLGFDLLTGVFTLCPLALIDKRPGVTMGGILRTWGLVFCGNFAGCADGGDHDGHRLDLRLHRGAQCRRPEDRHHRRRPYGGLFRSRRGRHADAVHPRRAVQLDGVDGCRLRHDLHQRDRQGRRHVDADHGLLLHGLRALHRQRVPSSRPA